MTKICLILLLIFYDIYTFNNYKIKNFLLYETDTTKLKPSIIRFKPKINKKIVYFATSHTNDLDDEIHNKIKKVINEEKIDFCILEGFPSSEGICPQRIVDIFNEQVLNNNLNENLFAALLCNEKGISFIGGDIDESQYLTYIYKSGYSQKDLVFYLLAQQINFWNRDKKITKNNVEKLVNNFIANNILIWIKENNNSYNFQDFLKWHKNHIKKDFNVYEDFTWPTTSELMPSQSKLATIYQKLCFEIMNIRDLHILKTINRFLKKYDNLLVIFGLSHYEWQKKALEYLFKKPLSHEFI